MKAQKSNPVVVRQGKKCNPDGIVKDKPIALRLLPDELADAHRYAQEREESCSGFARQAYLLGLPHLLSQPKNPI